MSESLSDQLLAQLRLQPQQSMAIETLIVTVNAERRQILNAVTELTALGYTLQITETSIRLLSSPDCLTATEIKHKLTTEFIGTEIHAYQTLQSTNQTALQLASQGARNGTIVVAEQQTAGRGRLGRSWLSPSGLGIYITIILKPQFKTEQASGITLMTGLIVATTIEEQTGLPLAIKWPNDLLINGHKVCGILSEISADREKIEHLVVGIGININQSVADFPDDLRTTATSLQIATGRYINRVQLLQKLLLNFEKGYLLFMQSGLSPFLDQIKTKSSLIGQHIQIGYGEKSIEGIATDISTSGSLIVTTQSGQATVSGGEATILRD